MTEHILSVMVDNQPGVLSKVVGLFSRRGFNIESLAVGVTENEDISRITIVVKGDDRTVDQVCKQLHKLIAVKTVKVLENSVSRELVLVKVASRIEQRSSIIQIADIFRAKIIDVAPDSMTIEITGDNEKITALLTMAKDYGILEVVRTGMISLERGSDTI